MKYEIASVKEKDYPEGKATEVVVSTPDGSGLFAISDEFFGPSKGSIWKKDKVAYKALVDVRGVDGKKVSPESAKKAKKIVLVLDAPEDQAKKIAERILKVMSAVMDEAMTGPKALVAELKVILNEANDDDPRDELEALYDWDYVESEGPDVLRLDWSGGSAWVNASDKTGEGQAPPVLKKWLKKNKYRWSDVREEAVYGQDFGGRAEDDPERG